MLDFIKQEKKVLLLFTILYIIFFIYIFHLDTNKYIKVEITGNQEENRLISEINYALSLLDHRITFELDMNEAKFLRKDDLSLTKSNDNVFISQKNSQVPDALTFNIPNIRDNQVYSYFSEFISQKLRTFNNELNLSKNFNDIIITKKGPTTLLLTFAIKDTITDNEDAQNAIKQIFNTTETLVKKKLLEDTNNLIKDVQSRVYHLTALKLYNLSLLALIESEARQEIVYTKKQLSMNKRINELLSLKESVEIKKYYDSIVLNSNSDAIQTLANLYVQQYFDKKNLRIEFINQLFDKVFKKVNDEQFKGAIYNIENLKIESKQNKLLILLTYSLVFIFIVFTFFYIKITYRRF